MAVVGAVGWGLVSGGPTFGSAQKASVCAAPPALPRACAALYASSVCSAASLRSAPVLNSAR